MMERPVVIGSRGSALALWQAQEVSREIGRETEIRIIETAGDRFQSIPLQGRLEKGFFTKEIEERLLSGDIDVAVHSLKDLPTDPPDRLVVGACLPRGAASDLLLVRPGCMDQSLPLRLRPGSRVGATSLRRQALLRLWSPEAEPLLLRGNVPTRIRKCREGEYDAILLARAGVERLAPDLAPLLAFELDTEWWLPAPGQGAIAVEARENDRRILALLARIDDLPTRQAVEIERGLLARFEGGCHTAFGAIAESEAAVWNVRLGLDLPGKGWVAGAFRGPLAACLALAPDDIRAELRVPVLSREGLCRPYRPSF